MSDSALRAETWKVDLPTIERTSRDRGFDRVRWALIAAWVVVIACLPFFAERQSSWAHLKHQVLSGAVTHLEVNGEMFSGNGFSTVDLHWRENGLNYRANVVELIGKDADCAEDDVCYDGSVAKVHGPPSIRLQVLQTGLTVVRHRNANHDDDNELLGFAVPWFIAVIESLLGLAVLGILISGPQPWRATRWAWFWWLSHPVGLAAFLLLSGPARPIPPPRNPHRRLTGGWSFLLSLVFSSATITLWNVTLS